MQRSKGKVFSFFPIQGNPPSFREKGGGGLFWTKLPALAKRGGRGGSCTFLRGAFARRGEGGESHLLRKEGERGRGTKKEEEEGRNWANNLLSGGGWGEKGGLEEGKGRGNCIHPLPFRACLLLLRSHIVRSRGCCRMEEEGEEGHITWEEEPGNEVSLNLLLGPEGEGREGGRRLWKLVGGGPASSGLHTHGGGRREMGAHLPPTSPVASRAGLLRCGGWREVRKQKLFAMFSPFSPLSCQRGFFAAASGRFPFCNGRGEMRATMGSRARNGGRELCCCCSR